MKKLTKITNIYTLLDENDRMLASDDVDMQSDYQIGKLSKQNCDEIFGIIDVEKLAYDSSQEYLIKPIESPIFTFGYEQGFNKAMELDKDKVFTLEDMRKAIAYGESVKDMDEGKIPYKTFDNFIQSLQQPKEIEVDIEMETVSEGLDEMAQPQYTKVPKLDSEGCIILKRIV